MTVQNDSPEQQALEAVTKGFINQIKSWLAAKLKHPATATAYVFMGVVIIKAIIAIPVVDQILCQSTDLGSEFCEVFNHIAADEAEDIIDE